MLANFVSETGQTILIPLCAGNNKAVLGHWRVLEGRYRRVWQPSNILPLGYGCRVAPNAPIILFLLNVPPTSS